MDDMNNRKRLRELLEGFCKNWEQDSEAHIVNLNRSGKSWWVFETPRSSDQEEKEEEEDCELSRAEFDQFMDQVLAFWDKMEEMSLYSDHPHPYIKMIAHFIYATVDVMDGERGTICMEEGDELINDFCQRLASLREGRDLPESDEEDDHGHGPKPPRNSIGGQGGIDFLSPR